MNYYNEFDPFAADWLRELIKAGLIPAGEVDERSIVDVQGADLAGFAQCHFFAGIAGWPVALALAGWPADCPVWTGSCPCQPFSVAGKGGAERDERHLWPEFHRLIAECRPPVVFGEQVASPLGREWLTGVRNDLEALAYAFGAADLCAASVGSPTIRQRLYWVADSDSGQRGRVAIGRGSDGKEIGWQQGDGQPEPGGEVGGLASAGRERARRGLRGSGEGSEAPGFRSPDQPERPGPTGGLGDTHHQRLEGRRHYEPAERREVAAGSTTAAGLARFWGRVFIECTDGKWRGIPLEPELFPLASGVPARVGKLRGAGNAIVPPLAAAFIEASGVRP